MTKYQFWIIILLIVIISTLTLVGMVMKLDAEEVLAGDGILGSTLGYMIGSVRSTKKEQ